MWFRHRRGQRRIEDLNSCDRPALITAQNVVTPTLYGPSYLEFACRADAVAVTKTRRNLSIAARDASISSLPGCDLSYFKAESRAKPCLRVDTFGPRSSTLAPTPRCLSGTRHFRGEI